MESGMSVPEEFINLDALSAEYDAELRARDGQPPTQEPLGTEPPTRPESVPPGRPVDQAPDTATATAQPPPVTDGTPEPPKTVDPVEERVARLEALLAKQENDLVLARKEQAAAGRRLAAIREAQQLEQQRQAQLRAQNALTQEELDKGVVLQGGWVERREQEARQLEEQQMAQAETARNAEQNALSEARREFARQAMPLSREMIALGLDPAEKSNANPEDPEELLYEGLLREALKHPDLAQDIRLTWIVDDPDEQARLNGRIYNGGRAAALAKLSALAQAKGTVEARKAAITQYDRVTSPGTPGGGDDPYNNMHPDDMWQHIVWKED